MSGDLLERVIGAESFSPLDLRLAYLLRRLSRQDAAADIVATSAALVSRQRSQGHSCLHLGRWGGRALGSQSGRVRLPSRDAWRTVLEQSPLVAVSPRLGDEARPLVLDAGDRLYLWRYWQAEQKLAQELHRRLQAPPRSAPPTDTEIALFRRLFPKASEPGEEDRQAMAAAAALRGSFTLISGGPGTGKTTTVTRILALLAARDRDTRFALAAPTGKAATRLEESIADQLTDLAVEPEVRGRIPRRASTLHRLLGYSPRRDAFRYGEGSPLPVDVLVVDEASMVDLLMMQNVVEALPSTARLILLGDRDQLASVDTGFVFGDFTTAAGLGSVAPAETDAPTAAFYEALVGRPWPAPQQEELSTTEASPGPEHGAGAPWEGASESGEDWNLEPWPAGEEPDPWPASMETEAAPSTVLHGRGVELNVSYRFRRRLGIGTLAGAVRRGDVETLRQALDDPSLQDVSWKSLPESPDRSLLEPVQEKILACRTADGPAAALRQLASFRILAATRVGSWGTERLNVLVESFLDFHGHPSLERFYPGRPLLVESNDYQSRLFNGDLGIVWPDDGGLWAFFPEDVPTVDGLDATQRTSASGLRRLPLAKLPRHSTAWAMTVHKSQGSEFDHVLLVLPDHDLGDLLNRELLYTGITRAKQQVDLRAPGPVLENATHRSNRRRSGLVDALRLPDDDMAWALSSGRAP